MADDRLPCRDDYTALVSKLNDINTQVTALNTLMASLGLVSITPISQADYDNLSPTDKLNGVFDIYDAVEPQISPLQVDYGNSTLSNLPNELFKTFEVNLQGATITSYWGTIPTNIDTSKYKPISILEAPSWEENLNYMLDNGGSTIHIKSRVENYTISQNRKVYVVCIVL